MTSCHIDSPCRPIDVTSRRFVIELERAPKGFTFFSEMRILVQVTKRSVRICFASTTSRECSCVVAATGHSPTRPVCTSTCRACCGTAHPVRLRFWPEVPQKVRQFRISARLPSELSSDACWVSDGPTSTMDESPRGSPSYSTETLLTHHFMNHSVASGTGTASSNINNNNNAKTTNNNTSIKSIFPMIMRKENLLTHMKKVSFPKKNLLVNSKLECGRL